MGSQPLLLNQKPKLLQKPTMDMPDTVLDIETTDMVDTMVMDTVMDTHTTDMDMDTDTTVARDPLMLTQLYSMVPMPHTPHTVMDMPHTLMLHTDLPLLLPTNT